MKKIFLILLTAFLIPHQSFADNNFQKIKAEIAKLVKAYYLEATIEENESEFIAKLNTLEYTLHSVYKTGEISERTFNIEGPNYKGFKLKLTFVPTGPYMGQLVVPQTVNGPYFPTFVNAINLETKEYIHISFAYGKGIDPGFKNSLFEIILPKQPNNANEADMNKPGGLP